MIDNKWFCEPNEERETWCFLTLQTKDLKGQLTLDGWTIGYGNPNTIHREIHSNGDNEREILEQLFRELYYCRRKGITLVTFGKNILPILRIRTAQRNLKDASFRGIDIICLEDLLETYFDPVFYGTSDSGLVEVCQKINIETNGTTNTELMLQLLLRIDPLLPQGVI